MSSGVKKEEGGTELWSHECCSEQPIYSVRQRGATEGGVSAVVIDRILLHEGYFGSRFVSVRKERRREH